MIFIPNFICYVKLVQKIPGGHANGRTHGRSVKGLYFVIKYKPKGRKHAMFMLSSDAE